MGINTSCSSNLNKQFESCSRTFVSSTNSFLLAAGVTVVVFSTVLGAVGCGVVGGFVAWLAGAGDTTFLGAVWALWVLLKVGEASVSTLLGGVALGACLISSALKVAPSFAGNVGKGIKIAP